LAPDVKSSHETPREPFQLLDEIRDVLSVEVKLGNRIWIGLASALGSIGCLLSIVFERIAE